MSDMFNISDEQIRAAKEWEIKSNINIMYPTDDIDLQYNKYMDQPKDKRRKADWQALDLYGVDNTTLYSMLKSRDIIKFNKNETDVDKLSKQLVDLDNYEPQSVMESYEIKNTKKKIENKINELSNKKQMWEFFYAPYFHPQEINELEGFYSESVEESCKAINEEYNKYFNGYDNNFDIISWDSEVRRLSYKLEYAIYNNDQNVNRYKQSLVHIGWNPEIKYNDENKHKARIRLESLMNRNDESIKIINAVNLFECFTISESATELQEQELCPISVILVRGDSPVSNLIANTTKGDYSHSAICIDNDFDRLYSFNMCNQDGKDGFSLESIRNYPQNNKMSIFSFFVSKDTYNKIQQTIQKILNNINNSRYSFINILTMPFKNININMPEKMICSQFVDSILKMANINITHIDSSKVTPNYLYKKAINSSRVYKIYEGRVKDFNFSKATAYLNDLSKKKKSVSESSDDIYCIETEINNNPIFNEFNIDNYDSEFTNTAISLLEYFNSDNTEVVKEELCKLYYMNYMLEKKVYSNRYADQRNHIINLRSDIIDAINECVDYINIYESNFDFNSYYDESSYSSVTFNPKSNSIRNIKSIINDIL